MAKLNVSQKEDKITVDGKELALSKILYSLDCTSNKVGILRFAVQGMSASGYLDDSVVVELIESLGDVQDDITDIRESLYNENEQDGGKNA